MSDKDLGEGLEKFEEEVENLKNTKMKLFGISMTPTTIGAAVALVGSILGGLYGAFEVYKDYMGMKEIIENIDTGAIAARNNEIEIKLDQAIDFTRDIRNGLRQDILKLESAIDRMEDKVEASENRMKDAQNSIEQSLNNSENRIKDTQASIENTLESIRNDMNQVEKDVNASIREVEKLNRETEKDVRDTMRQTESRIDADMRQLETDLTKKLQEALDNPLNDMK